MSSLQADLFVVGDPDQAIYGWRGAQAGNMTQALTKDFKDTQVRECIARLRRCRLSERCFPQSNGRRQRAGAR